MITITAPFISNVSGALSLSDCFTYSAMASALLILALILQEILESDNVRNRKTIEVLEIIILPLAFVFCVIVSYSILKVLHFD